MRGAALGEFDHVTWVTMTDQGPRMANLLVDGILPENITTESHQIFWRSLLFDEYYEKGTNLHGKTLTLPIRNSFSYDIKGEMNWSQTTNSQWLVKPTAIELVLKPGEEKTVQFKISRATNSKQLKRAPLPKLALRFQDEINKLDLDMSLEVPLEK